jgi:hypothetical protein
MGANWWLRCIFLGLTIITFPFPTGSNVPGSDLQLLHPAEVHYGFRSQLEEWLRSLAISLPSQNFKVSGFQVNASEIICGSLQLDRLHTTEAASNTAITYRVDHARAKCSLRWAYKGNGLQDQGSLVANLTNAAVFGNLSLQLSGTPALPSSALLASCSVSIDVSLKFSGGLSAQVLNLLRPAFTGLLQRLVPVEVCRQLRGLVAGKLSRGLVAATRYARQTMSDIKPVEDPLLPGMVHWQESSILHDADAILDALLGPDSPVSLRRLIDCLTGDTGALGLQGLNYTSPWIGPLLNGTYLRIGLNDFFLDGLDTVSPSNSSVARPWGNQSLAFQMAFEGLRARVNGTVHAHPNSPTIRGANLTEHFALALSLAPLALDVVLRVVLDQSQVNAFDDVQLVQPACLARAIPPHGLKVLDAALKSGLPNITLMAREGALEADLDRAITATLAVALDAYAGALPALLTALAARFALPPINDWLAEEVRKAGATPCPAVAPHAGPPEAPPLAESDLSRWLEALRVDLPPVSFAVLGFNASVADLSCGAIHFIGLNSTQSQTDPTTLSVAVSGVRLRCGGSYRVGRGNHTEAAGGFALTIEDAAASLGLRLTLGGKPPAASAAALTTCSAALSLTELRFDGDDSAWVANVLAPWVQAVVRRDGGGLLCDALLPRAVAKGLNPLVRRLSDGLRTQAAKPDPRRLPEPPAVPGMIPWRDEAFLRDAQRAVSALVRSIDDFVSNLTDGAGALAFDNLHMKLPDVPIPNVGMLGVTITGFAVDGLASWRELEVLRPSGDHSLDVQVAADRVGLRLTAEVTGHFASRQHPDPWAPDLTQSLRLSVGMPLRNLQATVFLPVRQAAVAHLSGSQLVSAACLLPAVDSVALSYLRVDIGDPQLTVLTGNGEPNTMEALASAALRIFVEGYVALLPGALTGSLNDAVGVVNGLAPGLLAVAKLGAGACPADALAADAATADRNRLVGYVAIVLFATAVVAALGWAAWYERRRLTSEGAVGARPLLFHARLPWYVRYFLPLLICVNLLLFVSSNTSTGAVVGLRVTLLGDVYRLPQGLFAFALGNTVDQMWHAGVYPLAILIAVFSGMWPYIKLCLMLLLWVTPEGLFGVARREACLVWIDRLGKWSLIDAYVLVLMIVAFRFHAGQTIPGAGPTALDIIVTPEWGFFSFLLATQLSLLLSHLTLAAYRHTARPEGFTPDPKPSGEEGDEGEGEEEQEWGKAADVPESLSHHVFRFGPVRLSLSRARWAVPALLLLAALFLGLGAFLKTFRFHFAGLAGYVLSDGATAAYSLVSLAMALPGSTLDPGSLPLLWIQATYLLFAFIVPLLQLSALLVLWSVPLRRAAQRRWFVAAEVLSAWSALDVFIISIVAALLQIRQFARFIVGGRCDLINAFLARHFAGQLPGDAICFDVRATVEPASAVLFTAGAVLFAATYVVMALCLCAIGQRCAGSPDALVFAPLGPVGTAVARLLVATGLLEGATAGEAAPLRGGPSDDEDAAAGPSAT